jgi:acetyl-CoA carboxylase alpha subunit
MHGEASREKFTTQQATKNSLSDIHEHKKKSKSKTKSHNSKKKGSQKKSRARDMKRPGSALGYMKHKNLRSNSGKSKHYRNNESIYLEKFKSKETTLKHDDTI